MKGITITAKNIHRLMKSAITKLRAMDKFELPEVSICCGVERSQIYPRDCWQCGALFVPHHRP